MPATDFQKQQSEARLQHESDCLQGIREGLSRSGGLLTRWCGELDPALDVDSNLKAIKGAEAQLTIMRQQLANARRHTRALHKVKTERENGVFRA